MTINIEDFLDEVETNYLIDELLERTDFTDDAKKALSEFCNEEFGQDISDYDTDELIAELLDRNLNGDERESLKELVLETDDDYLEMYLEEYFDTKSAPDKWKFLFFRDNFDKITLEQLEQLILK